MREMVDFLMKASYTDAIKVYAAFLNDPNTDLWAIGALGKADRFFLLSNILRRPDLAHPWLYERVREVEQDPDAHLDLWARYHYKSTIITFAGTIQEILNDPNITIGIFSHTRPIAKAFLTQIKREFEDNQNLFLLYPDVCWENPNKESPKWSEDDGIILRRTSNPKEATIEAWGLVDGQPTSKHFALRLYDDIVTDKSVNTPDQIEKTTKALELSYNLGTRGGREQFCGTRYAYADTYQIMMDRGSVGTRIYPATDDGTMDGNPVFLTQEEWEELKSKSGLYTIACQQLLNPIAGSEQTFSPEWIRHYDIRPKTLNVYITVDPASERKKTSNRTAMVVTGVDASLNKYLLDGMCHRMKLSERWENLKMLRQKWLRAPGVQNVFVGYEKYGMQADIEHFEEMMKIESRKQGASAYFPIKELNWPREGPASKVARVSRLQPDFQNWRYFLPVLEMTDRQREMIKQGQGYLAVPPIRRKNEEGKPYDVTEWMLLHEFRLFPAIHPDFMDAMSRLYDMEISAPTLYAQEALDPDPEPAF